LAPEHFDFGQVSAVVMDEFHSFSDPERGIVWEISLSLLPSHVRLLLLSATVGNSREFMNWLERCHHRKLELVEGTERKVPLSYHWIPDELLNEQLVLMAKGDSNIRKMPALVFCFNRDECWSVAEQLKGLPLVDSNVRQELLARCNKLEWKDGIGPKLKQMLGRGVGVHHAGLLPKYRRTVEELFEKKLLAVVVCTETLGAGINLPARSVVLTSLVKGPYGKQKLIDASTAHQIFGRAGRPQFDSEGHVYALAHEDDVKLLRWKLKYDSIPEDTRDPGLIKAKKDLKRKKPERRANQTYWNEAQFRSLQLAPPGKLYSKGPLPWRVLAYLLQASPEVGRLKAVIQKRLLDDARITAGEKQLNRMLITLNKGGFVVLEPPHEELITDGKRLDNSARPESPPSIIPSKHYEPVFARATPKLEQLLAFRSIHPLYGVFLMDYLAVASRAERLQLLESLLELPKALLRYVRVPRPDKLPPGPLATQIDPLLVKHGLISAPRSSEKGENEDELENQEEEFPLCLAEKMKLVFELEYPEIGDLMVQGVWAAGELFEYKGNFVKYISSKDLAKQEGILFRHFLRLVLLCGEFRTLTPAGMNREDWQR
ncbi:MAG TPA: helicase-related protein, partial [Gemmatales bacterium]|nr:helicase-related protein [Gemmatales bacterium]